MEFDLVASYVDPDFEDLIEWAFLEGQIDGVTMELAYSSLMAYRLEFAQNVTQGIKGYTNNDVTLCFVWRPRRDSNSRPSA